MPGGGKMFTGDEVTFEEKMELRNDRACYLPSMPGILVLDWALSMNAKEAKKLGLDSWHTCIEFGYWVE